MKYSKVQKSFKIESKKDIITSMIKKIITTICALSCLVAFEVIAEDLPGKTITSKQLQYDVIPQTFGLVEAVLGIKDCNKRKVLNTEVVQPPVDPTYNDKGVLLSGTWTEKWTISTCKQKAEILIEFIPDGKGGTTFMSGAKKVKKI